MLIGKIIKEFSKITINSVIKQQNKDRENVIKSDYN